MLLKCCTQYVSKFGRLSNGHRTGKGQFSFQSQRKAMPKNVQTTTQLHTSHMLAKSCSKFSKPGFNSMLTEPRTSRCSSWKRERNQRFRFRKDRGTKDQIANICWILEKARNSRKTSASASLTTLKPLTVWITTHCGKFFRRWEYQTTLPAS